ncbi:MAG TPA: carbamoyltransferase [Rhodospirillaceae bacterium]|nr:carbamoyltransferase [Rhodospirillaceae bacterium]
MICLGLHAGGADASAALLVDGQLVAMMEQERFDHQKHSAAFPTDAVDFCLNFAGLALAEVDLVAHATDLADEEIMRALGSCQKVVRHLHHQAHAASVFLTSPFERAAILTLDGCGGGISTSLGQGEALGMTSLVQVPCPHSLGLFYGAFTQYLGFAAGGDEGKTMGLAAYGQPRFLDALRSLCRVTEQGGFELDLSWFAFSSGCGGIVPRVPSYSGKMVERFGPPRLAEADIKERDVDLAASVQALLEERCQELLAVLHRLTGLDTVCLAGGVALNCSMNGRIRATTPFRDVFVTPAANDAGLSLGAALLASRDLDPGFRRQALTHAYYGSAHDEQEMAQALAQLAPEVQVCRPPQLAEAVADLLAEHQIVGWYQGRMEFGPRALGHRSILANPGRAEAKDRVNAKVKFREGFRPFAPVVPNEDADSWFVQGQNQPFMLTVDRVRPERSHQIPAVTHVDGTARVQTVTVEQNAGLHGLLKAMERRNGVPVLLNTSFNVRGDTIVRTPMDAVRCFLDTGMNALAIGPFLAVKTIYS